MFENGLFSGEAGTLPGVVGACAHCADPDKGPKLELPEFLATAARVAYAADKAYDETLGDFSSSAWAEASPEARASAQSGVYFVMLGTCAPSDLHEHWMVEKLKSGWRFGREKDPEARTHPNLLPWSSLSAPVQRKDRLFLNVVRVFTAPFTDLLLFSRSLSPTEHYRECMARVCHETLREYGAAGGETERMPWLHASVEDREITRNGVRRLIEHGSMFRLLADAKVDFRALHEQWLTDRLRQGWRYDSIYQPGKKRHPALLPWAHLPVAEKRRTWLFAAVVAALLDIPSVPFSEEPRPAPSDEMKA